MSSLQGIFYLADIKCKVKMGDKTGDIIGDIMGDKMRDKTGDIMRELTSQLFTSNKVKLGVQFRFYFLQLRF